MSARLSLVVWVIFSDKRLFKGERTPLNLFKGERTPLNLLKGERTPLNLLKGERTPEQPPHATPQYIRPPPSICGLRPPTPFFEFENAILSLKYRT